MGNTLKSSFVVSMQTAREGGSFYGKWGFSTVLNFIVSLNGYCKRFYGVPLIPVLPLFYLFFSIY